MAGKGVSVRKNPPNSLAMDAGGVKLAKVGKRPGWLGYILGPWKSYPVTVYSGIIYFV